MMRKVRSNVGHPPCECAAVAEISLSAVTVAQGGKGAIVPPANLRCRATQGAELV